MFLVGRGIPEHITNLPRRILDTPFGRMLQPQIDAGMREITQAPVVSPPSQASSSKVATNGVGATSSGPVNGSSSTKGQVSTSYGSVINVTNLNELERHLESASSTTATIFFTSSTCAPCKMAYPMFDRLAEQHPQSLFLKVDINAAHDIASRYQIRATPTFMTFARAPSKTNGKGPIRTC